MLHTAILSVFVTLWGFAYTSARPDSTHITVKQIGHPDDMAMLRVRQNGVVAVPSQCESTCDTPNSIIADVCTTFTCCTTMFEIEYFNCIVCVSNALSLTNLTIFQVNINELEQACADVGIDIPTLTLLPQGDGSLTSLATSMFTTPTPASMSSVNSPVTSSASLSLLTSLQLPMPSGSIPSSTIVQQTVSTGSTVTAPASASTTSPASASTTASASSSTTAPASASTTAGVPTLRVSTSFAWAVTLAFVIVAIGYL
ncbi:hypothetical protein H2248_005793 [Termitomyces sp. 'cryptogamus']|nr:hypothetical protein H2248_005793 [Termitomyces sp. 'cryptogamus']